MAAESAEGTAEQTLDSDGESSAKRQIERIVRELPDDSSFDDILRELAFHRMMARGLADADRSEVVSHSDVLRRSRTWIR